MIGRYHFALVFSIPSFVPDLSRHHFFQKLPLIKDIGLLLPGISRKPSQDMSPDLRQNRKYYEKTGRFRPSPTQGGLTSQCRQGQHEYATKRGGDATPGSVPVSRQR